MLKRFLSLAGLTRGTAIALLALVFCAGAAAAENLPIKAFFGDYAGSSETKPAGGQAVPRDLGVFIKSAKRGFSMQWSTTDRRPDGRLKTKTYKIVFSATKRPSIYQSAMQTNAFGGRVPLDPLKGEPYVWARITGNTLTVYALLILDDGGFEIQRYDRTLADGGLQLVFNRVRNGVPLKRITATLKKTGG